MQKPRYVEIYGETKARIEQNIDKVLKNVHAKYNSRWKSKNVHALRVYQEKGGGGRRPPPPFSWPSPLLMYVLTFPA